MTAQIIPIRDGNDTPLRRDLVASVDMISAGGTIRDAGIAMMSAGTHIMQLNEPPTEGMIRELEQLGASVIGVAAALRLLSVYQMGRG